MPFDNFQLLISEVLEEAYKELSKCKAWCVIKTYDPAVNNSYENLAYRAFYTLKYFPAYLVEYFFIYKKIRSLFKFDFEQKSILSIGCGSGIDYYAIRNLMGNENFKYTGVDIHEWEYRPEVTNAQFYDTGIESITEEQIADTDVFIFPKSIANMSPYINNFAKKILNKGKDEIIIGYSFCTHTDTDSVHGKLEAEQLHNFLKSKYNMDENSTGPDTCMVWKSEEYKGLRSIHQDFVYPEKMKKALEDFKEQCLSSDDAKCVSCNEKSFPILTTKYGAFAYKKYIRK